MEIAELEFLRCPKCYGLLELIESESITDETADGKLACKSCNQLYPILNSIPQLFIEEDISERDLFFTQQADGYSRYYDKLLKVFGLLMFSWEPRMRKKFIQKLGIKEGSIMLDICTGPGNNLVPLRKYLSNKGKLVAIDLSEKMLEKCQHKMQKKKIPVFIHQGNALQLPYKDNYFDVTISSGGINTFGDRSKGIEEIIRVTKSGGMVIITDEGLKPGMENTWIGKRLIKMNNLYTMKPPTELLPKSINYEVDYIYKDTMYVLKFNAP
ncbi:MAG: class I SAM-dependent methyltransferase [Candidatus Heimdallarchaeota archaeon]